MLKEDAGEGKVSECVDPDMSKFTGIVFELP